MRINIKKIDANAITPTRGSEYAAGYDLYAHIDTEYVEILPGETKKIGSGICAEIPEGYFGAIFARSGMATKYGLRPSNCVGVIDSDYRGEIIIPLHNDSKHIRAVCNGDRVAQLVIMPFKQAEFIEVNDLDNTYRGNCGFGSTGTNVSEDKMYEQLTLF